MPGNLGTMLFPISNNLGTADLRRLGGVGWDAGLFERYSRGREAVHAKNPRCFSDLVLIYGNSGIKNGTWAETTKVTKPRRSAEMR